MERNIMQEDLIGNMSNMTFIQVVPVDIYFEWQVSVQITNFRKFGISNRMQILVWYPEHRRNELKRWKDLEIKYPEVEIFYYKDEGVNLSLYIPQLRPHTLKKHFARFPELTERVLFYHDSDIIFSRKPDFELLYSDDVCWQSDCSGYLDYEYLARKEKEGNLPEGKAITLLAEIGRVSVETIESYTGKTGGAQSIIKGVDHLFWQDVEDQCIAIRKAFAFGQPGSINSVYFKTEAEGFQSWTADMWALNFALWNRGLVTDVTKDLDFSWATDSLETFNKKPIFHNAGVPNKPEPPRNLFYKGQWIHESPIGKDLILPAEDTASSQYVKAILDVK